MSRVYKIRRFSEILNTKISGIGFHNKRNYDQDLNRLSSGKTQREMNLPNQFNNEMRKLSNELSEMKTR